MRGLRLVCIIVVALTMSGCLAGRINKVMQSWQGNHYSSLIMSWGPPQAVYEDGQGGRILVYTAQRQWTTPGQVQTVTTAQARVYDNMIWGQAQSFSSFTPPQVHGYTAWRMFQIDRSGRIYSWSWRGL